MGELLAYVAGYLDGEGCFSVDKKWKIRVSCANTHKPTVDWLHTTFGGTVVRSKPRVVGCG